MGKELGDRIKNMIEKRSLTNKYVCARAHISESQLSRYIAGIREPKPAVLANIATALNTTSDYLLGIEREEDFNICRIESMLARNSSSLSNSEKKKLIVAIMGDD